MIDIQLVKITLADGTVALVGRRYQDRWNLETMGIKYIPYTRNSIAIKKLRRCYGDFTFTTVSGPTVSISMAEYAMYHSVKRAA